MWRTKFSASGSIFPRPSLLCFEIYLGSRTFNALEKFVFDLSCLPRVKSHFWPTTFNYQYFTTPRNSGTGVTLDLERENMGKGKVDEKQGLHVENATEEPAGVVDGDVYLPPGWWSWRVVANSKVFQPHVKS